MFPIEIKFPNMPTSDFVYNKIFACAEKLAHHYPKIMSCKVVVSDPHKKHHKGKIFHVEIHLHIPGKEIIVNRDPEKNSAHENAYVAIRDVFDSAVRQLEENAKTKRRKEKVSIKALAL